MIEDRAVTPAIRTAALAASGLTPELLRQVHGFIPYDAEIELIDALTALMEDPLFPVAAGLRHRNRRGGGLLVYLLCQCSNLGEALAMLERYLPVLRPAIAIRRIETEDEIHLRITIREDSLGNLGAWTVGVLCGLPRELVGLDDLPSRARLSAELPDMDGWAEVLGVPTTGGQASDRLVFTRAQAAQPVPGADPDLKVLLLGIAEIMRSMAGVRDAAIVPKVREALARTMIQGRIGIDDVARDLNVSKRSLQRRLAEENTRFSDILGETRRALALRYLANERLPIAHVAVLLGYNDQASFSRAFKAMSGGEAPGQYRRRLRGSSGGEGTI